MKKCWVGAFGGRGARRRALGRGRGLGRLILAFGLGLPLLISCSSGADGRHRFASSAGRGAEAGGTGITRIETRQFRPRSRAATKYESLSPEAPPQSELGRRMAKLRITYDKKLAAIADDVAVALPGGIFEVPPQLVDGMMSWHGLAGVAPNLWIFEQSGMDRDRQGNPCDPNRCPPDLAMFDRALNSLSPSAAPRVAGWSRWQSVGPKRWRKVIALAENPFTLNPLSKSARRGQGLQLRGRLSRNLKNPRVWVAAPSRRAFELKAQSRPDGAFAAQMSCGQQRGAYQVELVADGRYGPEVLANFPVYCAAPPPSQLNFRVEWVDPKASAQELEQLSFDLINEVRRRYRLPLLAWSAEVADVARKHSRDMERLDYVGHVSPRTGSLGDRMRRGKIQSSLALENVALGSGPYSILDSLMLSPGHQANLLDPRVTHVGVGIALRTTFGRSSSGGSNARVSLYLTQNFTQQRSAKSKGSKRSQRPPSIRLVYVSSHAEQTEAVECGSGPRLVDPGVECDLSSWGEVGPAESQPAEWPGATTEEGDSGPKPGGEEFWRSGAAIGSAAESENP